MRGRHVGVIVLGVACACARTEPWPYGAGANASDDGATTGDSAGDTVGGDVPAGDDATGDSGACAASAGDFRGNTGIAVSIFQWPNYRYIGSRFVADGTAGAVCAAAVTLSRTGSPTGSLRASIWTDNASVSPSVPLAQLGQESDAIPIASINSTGETLFVGLAQATLTPGTTYWLVLRSDAPAEDLNNYAKWTKADELANCGVANTPNPSQTPWGCYDWGGLSFLVFK